MTGENDLGQLLRQMQPMLADAPYAIVTTEGGVPPGIKPFATIAEAEGLTLIATHDALTAAGFIGDRWARISLTIHSDLSAVGLTAAIATALAGQGISANVVAGYFHDHVFVQWDRRDDALRTLALLTEVVTD